MGCNSFRVNLAKAREMGRGQSGKTVTQQELAGLLGLKNREQVAYWENGTREPKAEQIFQCAKFLNVSADYLLGLSPVPGNDPEMKSAQAYTGLSPDTLAFLNEYKDDVGGPQWKLIQMMELLLQHPAILAALCNAEETAVLISGSDPEKAIEQDSSDAPDEVKMLDTVQEWQKEIKVLLFDLSNTVVDFAEEHLCVKETQNKLDKLEKDLRAKVQDLLS